MSVSNWIKVLGVVLIVSVGVQVRIGNVASTSVIAQEGAAPSAAAKKPAYEGMPPDPYDRNAQTWAYTRMGAKSGAERGQEIYYMQCWMCHSEYVIAGDTWPAASLRDVTKRLSDDMIKMQLRAGSARMPAFSEKQLPDADIADLLALFKEKCGKFEKGGGCFDEHNPPRNPLYKFEPDERTARNTAGEPDSK